ncbi:PDZ domain-containing protein [Candidatus Omnitrophota bacterium]
MRKFNSVVVIAFLVLFFCAEVSADTVILRSGKRLKGLILDEYKDRIILSTGEGEKIIMKSKIRSAIYDSEEKALIQKARNQLKKHQYIKAYYTYKKAADLNPEHKEALERVSYLRGYLETKTRDDVLNNIRTNKERFEGLEGKTMSRRVAEELGLTLGQGEKYVFVKKISGRNPSDEVKQGDKIVGVWGEMTAYMDTDEVGNMLLSPGEVKFRIERAVRPVLSASNSMFSKYRKIMGARLKLEKKGIIIERVAPKGPLGKAGIANNDLLFRINGKNTRYMPLSNVLDIIRSNQGKEIDIDIRRDVTLWKQE